mgnify:CR=1 FL=1
MSSLRVTRGSTASRVFLVILMAAVAVLAFAPSFVEPATQRSRDEVRRRILQSELEDEEKRLQAAKEKLAAAGKTARPSAELAAVEQHEKNISELKRTQPSLSHARTTVTTS